MKKEYSIWKGLGKTLINFSLIAGPLVLEAMPKEWMDVSVGVALGMLWNWYKVKYGQK